MYSSIPKVFTSLVKQALHFVLGLPTGHLPTILIPLLHSANCLLPFLRVQTISVFFSLIMKTIITIIFVIITVIMSILLLPVSADILLLHVFDILIFHSRLKNDSMIQQPLNGTHLGMRSSHSRFSRRKVENRYRLLCLVGFCYGKAIK